MDKNRKLLILGAGQYGQVAKDVAESTGCFDKIDFLDDNQDRSIGKLEDLDKFSEEYSMAFVAIGNPETRLAYICKLENAGFEIASLVSPKVFISSSAQIMKGTIIEPMAVVNANSSVSVGVIVCAGAIINHNAVVGEGCQLDCGSVVGANAVLPPKTKIQYNEVYEKKHADIKSVPFSSKI